MLAGVVTCVALKFHGEKKEFWLFLIESTDSPATSDLSVCPLRAKLDFQSHGQRSIYCTYETWQLHGLLLLQQSSIFSIVKRYWV